eukprot:gnl/TRDRNA2_/TRDRNA2_35236_c0_seq1.p1 gnl/TRDRNA2_/TRDRNA2_35236_c0~~gnl/TRDRNA2_/TRDRNA2_35236_c0_seq1.p1  ORF type:complete len:838 (-),score=156.07 gnl/TRDRNA2_/TRDRNA2_35236_c0_seq1:206-2719(-)
MSPMSPSRGGYSSPSNRSRSRRSLDDPGICLLDPAGHKEKLPRPACGLSARTVYGCEVGGPGGVDDGGRREKVCGATEKDAPRWCIWTTTDSVMLRPYQVASSLPIPFAAICAPFADRADNPSVPLAEHGNPLRCPRCRSYANPYFRWAPREVGKVQCNMCTYNMPVERGDFANPKGEGDEEEEHPELIYGTVDFVPFEGADVDRPMGAAAPVVCFMLECSVTSVRNGVFGASLGALQHLLDLAELPLQRRMCLVLYDEETVHFFGSTARGFRMLTVASLEDPYVPGSPEMLFADLDDEEQRKRLRDLLGHLHEAPPVKPADESQADPGYCAGTSAALQMSIQAVADAGGGDVVMLHASAPLSPARQGSGAATASPAAALKGALQQAPKPVYQDTLALCVRGGIAVSALTASAPGMIFDVEPLQWLTLRTGGDCLHMQDFNPSHPIHGAHALSEHLMHWCAKMQASAYSCVFKLRCSKGLQATSLIAPWPAASSSSDQSAFELPRLSADASFAFMLQPEYDTSDDVDDGYYRRMDERKKSMYVQAVTLYTNCKGERLLRVHTTSLNVVHSVRAMFQGIQVGPLMALLMKQAANMALNRKAGSDRVQPRDYLQDFCVKVLASYRMHCCSADFNSSTLVASKALALFPLYVLAARKVLYALLGTQDGMEKRDALWRILKSPIHTLLGLLYPGVYALPVIDAPPEEDCQLLAPCPCLQEHVAKGASPGYLVANGSGAWLCGLGAAGDPEDEAAASALRQRAAGMCQQLRVEMEPSPMWMPLDELHTGAAGKPGDASASKDAWLQKVQAAALFVEDEGATEMSYGNWVAHLQKQILQRLEG